MPFVLDRVDGSTASCKLPSRDEDQMRSVTRGVHTADEWAHSLRRLWFRQREVALTG